MGRSRTPPGHLQWMHSCVRPRETFPRDVFAHASASFLDETSAYAAAAFLRGSDLARLRGAPQKEVIPPASAAFLKDASAYISATFP